MKLLRRVSLRRVYVLAVAVGAFALTLVSGASAEAGARVRTSIMDTIVVTSSADDGPGSLRQAIADAAPGDTITFDIDEPCGCGGGGGGDVGDLIVLTSGELVIQKNLSIIGPTDRGLAVSGDLNSRVFVVAPSVSLFLSNMIITEGWADSAGGGGILSYGELTLVNVLVTGNASEGEGGGINSEGTALTIFNSTISENVSLTDGGGLLNCDETTALLVNVTIVDNVADATAAGIGAGGGIGQVSSNPITLRNTIVAYNFNGFTEQYDDVFVYDDLVDDAFDSVLDPASHHNLIGVDIGFTGISHGVNGNLIGTADNPFDPLLGLLEYNGSPLYTYQPQQGSPVLDAGDNTAATDAGLTTDQRGFPRILDSGDADTVATVDMGSFEARASLTIADEVTIPEDTVGLVVPFNVGDPSTITSVAVSSLDPSLIPNNVANLLLSGTGAARTLTITPLANTFGTAVIRIRADADPNLDPDGFERFTATFMINVEAVADPPSVTNASTIAGVQTTTGLVITPSADDGSEVTHFKITNITGGLLYQTDGSTPIVNNEFITVADGGLGLKFTPANLFAGNATFQVQGALDALGAGLGSAVTATINVVNTPPTLNAIPDPVTIPEDSAQQTINLSGITAGAGETQSLVVTAMSLNPGLIPNPAVTYVSANATGSLAYTPAANASGSAVIRVAVADELGEAAIQTFTVTVTPIADTPSITNSATTVNGQNPAGLQVSRNPADSTEVTHVRVTNITNGTLFQNDGVTPIADGAFITIAQGAAGLRFLPAVDSVATGHITIQASTSALVAGLGGGTVTADIIVTQLLSSTTVTTSGSPSAPGQAVTFTATVSPAAAAASGTVQFMDGATALGSPVALVGGIATFSTSALTLGVHPISAVYSGNALAFASSGTLPGGQVVRIPVSLITGADAGGAPHVRRFVALDGSAPPIGALNSYFAFATSFPGGVRVAEGDVNGDGVSDYIAGAGSGMSPEVRIVDGATGAPLASLMAFEPAFAGGVFVAAGDVNGDGFVDVVVGSGEGRPGEVKVFSGRDFSLLSNTPIFQAECSCGVRVAAGDVNADGFADLVVGLGPGASGALVRVLSGANGSELRTFFAYDGFLGGVYVAAGDVNGDGYADIVTGAGAGGGPHVKVFDGRTGAVINGFFAFEPSFTGGVRVAAGDVNGDGHAEVITAPGPGRAPEVHVFDPVTNTRLATVFAYAPTFTGGVFVGTAVPVMRMAIDTPLAGAVVRSNFTVSGWALEDTIAPAGFSRIDVAATPVGGGAPVPLGSAVMGDPRPDVGAIYGVRYGNAGFHLAVTGLAPGAYDLAVRGVGAVNGEHVVTRTVQINVETDPVPLLAIDVPSAGLQRTGDFAVGGWALTPGNPSPPGVDAVHVWAEPLDGGGAWQFLGSAALGLPRPDVAAIFGSQYGTAGYFLNVTGLAAGAWDLHVFPRATGASAFAAARVVRVVVAGGPPRTLTTGTDAGSGPHVRRFSALDPTLPVAGPLTSFFAFDPSVTGGVRVAEGDVSGDGVPDYIVAPGAGVAPEVRIIDGAAGTIRASFLAFDADFRGGVFVAAADVNGDGVVDVIAGSGEGRRGQIKVFSGRDLAVLRDATVFDPSFTGGVHVAAGDVNGDGYADLIAGAGAGGSDVLVLNATDLSVLRTVTPYPGFAGGVWVGAGDVTGDGFADVITGAGPGGGPQVRVFDGRTGVPALTFLAYESGFTGGVHVAAGDVTGDGRADIMTGPGPGRAPEARVFEAATAQLLSSVMAYHPNFVGGVFVATAAPVNRMVIDVPPSGATVHGPFQLTGWAIDEHPSNPGLDAIHAWAFPVAGGLPVFAGMGILRDPRPDVAAFYGGQYARAGFHINIAGLAPGVYDVVVYGHGSASATFNIQRVVRITVTP